MRGQGGPMHPYRAGGTGGRVGGRDRKDSPPLCVQHPVLYTTLSTHTRTQFSAHYTLKHVCARRRIIAFACIVCIQPPPPFPSLGPLATCA